jgi:hypothetical protein
VKHVDLGALSADCCLGMGSLGSLGSLGSCVMIGALLGGKCDLVGDLWNDEILYYYLMTSRRWFRL